MWLGLFLRYSVYFGGAFFDGGDNGAGLRGDVGLGGESSEACYEVLPGFLYKDGEVVCADFGGSESCAVVAVGLFLADAHGSEAVGDECVSVGVSEVYADEHKNSFCKCCDGGWFGLGFRGLCVVVRRGSEDVVGTEFVD